MKFPDWVLMGSWNQELHSPVDAGQNISRRRGRENADALADSQNSSRSAVSNLLLAPPPRMCGSRGSRRTNILHGKRRQWYGSSLGEGGKQTPRCGKSAAASNPDRSRGSRRGGLLWKVSVSSLHSDRKRWLMPLRPLPAAERHSGKLTRPLILLLLLFSAVDGLLNAADEFVSSGWKPKNEIPSSADPEQSGAENADELLSSPSCLTKGNNNKRADFLWTER